MGFIVIDETKNFHGRDYNTWIKNGNVIIELQTPKNCVSVKNDSAGTGVIAHVCFLVDNLADTVNRLTEKGFNSFRKKHDEVIYEVKGGFLAKITAPEGTVIELREG